MLLRLTRIGNYLDAQWRRKVMTMAKETVPTREDEEHTQKLDKDFYVRNSRMEQRRYIAKDLLIALMANRDVNVHSWAVSDVDDTAKLAEDLAHALVRRLAAREEAEIAAGKFGATT